MSFVTVVGILLGLALAVGLAFLITASSLSKSNDFGDTDIPIDQYTGYTPPQITSVGQVSSKGVDWTSNFLNGNGNRNRW